MNRELKSMLKALASISGAPAMPRFRVMLERRAGGDAEAIEREWRNMIHMMPDLLERVRLGAAASAEPGAKRLYGFLLTYIYSSTDLIPEDGNGFFGYLDDAYLVAAAHRRISGVEALPDTSKWLDASRRVAPAETARLDEILEELLSGRSDSCLAALEAVAA